MRTTFVSYASIALFWMMMAPLLPGQDPTGASDAAQNPLLSPPLDAGQGGRLATLEKMLLGKWDGPACGGDYTFEPDGTYKLRHFTPGGNTLTGTWSVRWDALPPTLVLMCKTSDFRKSDPGRPEYAYLGKPLELKLLELNNERLAYRNLKENVDNSSDKEAHTLTDPDHQEAQPIRYTRARLRPVTGAADPSAALVAENAHLVKGLVLTGTLKQVIGYFGSHGRPEVGDTFEIDLDNLPQQMLRLKPHAGGSPYIPFSAPLTIEQVKQSGKATLPRRTVIHLSAVNTQGKFLIQVIAEGLESGSEIRIVLYKEGSQGFLPSMAEAEGVLK